MRKRSKRIVFVQLYFALNARGRRFRLWGVHTFGIIIKIIRSICKKEIQAIFDIRNQYTRNVMTRRPDSLQSHESSGPCESVHAVSHLQSNATLTSSMVREQRYSSEGYRREQRSAFPGVFAREKSRRFLDKIYLLRYLHTYTPYAAKAITRASFAAPGTCVSAVKRRNYIYIVNAWN